MANIEFSEEQNMLRETAVDFCKNKSPISAVRAAIEADAPVDASVWQEMVSLGWLAVTVPEEHGGLDMGLTCAAAITEAMGQHLLAVPFASTVLAIEALKTSGSETQQQTWLPQLATGGIGTLALVEEDGNWLLDEIAATGTLDGERVVLSGHKMLVEYAAVADLFVTSVRVDGQVCLALIGKDDLPEGAVQREIVIDETRRSYRLALDGISLPAAQVTGPADLASLEQAALLLLSAEMSGGLTGTIDVIVEYLNTRKQFERYIGSYQALKHPTVDILLAQEAAKSYVYHAATLLDQGSPEAETALRMAKAQGSEAFAFAGDRAVQFHGGFGFTYECDAQLFLRRALWCQHQFGDERHHRALLAPLLLDVAI